MNISVSTLLAIAASAVLAVFLLGTITYYAFIRKQKIILMAIFLEFGLLIYVGGFAAYTFSTDHSWVGIFNRLCYSGVTLLPFFFLLFIQEITGTQRPRMIMASGAVTSCIIAAIWIDTAYLITDTTVYVPQKGYYTNVTGPMFNAFIITVFAAITYSYTRLLVHFIRRPRERAVLLPLVAGFSLWIALSVFDGLVSAGLFPTMPPIPWAGPVILALMLSAYLGVLFEEQHRKLLATLDEKRFLNDKLVQTQKMEALGTLTGGLAHDFNNMLSVIIGSASMIELLLKDAEFGRKAEIATYIETINSVSGRATDIIRQMLSFSRKQELNMKPVDLNRSLENVNHICQNTFPKSIRLNFQTLESPATVYADPTQIEQSLLNLCVNAAHSMTIMRTDSETEGGTITVSLQELLPDETFRLSHPEAKNDTGYYSITVRDDGIGMDGDIVKRIFEPFFTTKGKDRGTGLGLSMVYNIITSHGGFIDVVSESGKGSIMTVYLPCPDEKVIPIHEESSIASVATGRGTVLVIDDEKDVITVTAGILRYAGYDALTATSGKEGLRLYRENRDRITVVLIDLSMSVMSGLETLQHLMAMDKNAKVLMVSGYPEDEEIKKSLAMGAQGFIQKPYTSRVLTERVRSLAAPDSLNVTA